MDAHTLRGTLARPNRAAYAALARARARAINSPAGPAWHATAAHARAEHALRAHAPATMPARSDLR